MKMGREELYVATAAPTSGVGTPPPPICHAGEGWRAYNSSSADERPLGPYALRFWNLSAPSSATSWPCMRQSIGLTRWRVVASHAGESERRSLLHGLFVLNKRCGIEQVTLSTH